MTSTGSRRTDAGSERMTSSPAHANADKPTGWIGWVMFASFMMFLMGSFQVVEGLVAIFNRSYYQVTSDHLVVHVNYTTWGWVHLLLGAVVLISAGGILVGNTAARTVGVVLAGLSAIVNLLFVAAYPFWSLLLIALDVLVIYALTVHGREMRTV